MIPLDPFDDIVAAIPDGEAFATAVTGPFRRAIRVHPRRGSPSGWRELSAVPWTAQGFFHAADEDPADFLDHHTGCAYAQDAASQLPVMLLDPRPGEIIIDACAAPGSKATQIGLALGDQGLVVACDPSAPRRRVLAETLGRQGVSCAVVTPLPLHRLAERVGAADAVLVDAPCSGHVRRSVRQVARMAEVQAAVLAASARLVRAGGRLVYSTCTPYRAENELAIERFLAANPGWSVEPLAMAGCDADLHGLGALRLWPQRQGTEPFFACRLRAPGEGSAGGFPGTLPPRDRRIERWLPGTTLHAWQRGDLLFAASPQAAACALPSDARGLIVARGSQLDLDPWGAQALIDRGAPVTARIPHADACQLWAGAALPVTLADGDLLSSDRGCPLGVATMAPDGLRLRLPSRLRRSALR